MSNPGELLEYLKQERSETKCQYLITQKGYSNLQDDDFGLNQWTQRLAPDHTDLLQEKQEMTCKHPGHLVSFLAIPVGREDELIDTNSKEFRDWVCPYQWKQIPRTEPPFSPAKAQACSEGLLIPKWIYPPERYLLELFLLIQRNGVVEFGIGREAYTLTEKAVIFNFITIVSRLWQFLDFTFDLYRQFYPDIQDGVLLFLNIRGTERALIGDLAEGWQQPGYHLINPYNPRCLDKHLQIRKQISFPVPTDGIEEVIQYFATRIDNAWGEFEPRCYVNEKRDASKPFAYRMPR